MKTITPISLSLECSILEVNGKKIAIPLSPAVELAATVSQAMAAVVALARVFNPTIHLDGDDAIPIIEQLIVHDRV